MNPPSLTQGVHWASSTSTHSASSQPTMLRVPVLETPDGTCLAPQVLQDWREMAGHAGLFPLTDMSTSTELKGLFRKDECWALGNGAGWPQSSSLPVPRAQLCGPALQALRAWWLQTLAAPSRITTVTGWHWEIPGAVTAPRGHDPMQAALTHCPISPACLRLPTLPQDTGALAALPDPHRYLHFSESWHGPRGACESPAPLSGH